MFLLLLVPGANAHSPPEGVEPDAFCIVVIEPLDGFRQLRITVDENLTAAAKDAFFDAADVVADGIIDADEARGFRLSQTEFWEGGLGMGNNSVYLQTNTEDAWVNPVRPIYAATWRHLGHGFYDDIPETSRDNVTFDGFETQEVREYAFAVQDRANVVTLVGGDAEYTANLEQTPQESPRTTGVIEYVVVKAPPGWYIYSVLGTTYTGQFQRTLEPGTERFDMAGFDTSERWIIKFMPMAADEKTQENAGASPFLGVVVVALVATLLRRRADGR